MDGMATADASKPPDDLPSPLNVPTLLGRLLFAAAALLVLFLLGTVVGWLTLASPGLDRLVQSVEGGDPGRLQAAVSLADVLRTPRHGSPREEVLLAQRLAAVLRREIRAGPWEPSRVSLAIYLCRILGELQAPDALDVLAEAAGGKGDQPISKPLPLDIRRAAVEALAMLATRLPAEEIRAHPGCRHALAAGCEDPAGEMRAATAFALGVVGGRESLPRLERLLNDPVADVRYNAAAALARLGNPAATAVLLEMLDANRIAPLLAEKAGDRHANLDAVRLNALRAAAQLASANPQADLAGLGGPVERLARGGNPHAIRIKALELLRQLQSR